MQTKAEKAWVFMANAVMLGEWPCGCKPFPCKCECKKTCKCEQQMEFCPHMTDWEYAETEGLLDKMAAFYLHVDPENYAEPPQDPDASPVKCHENHIRAMSRRVANGYSPFNRNDKYYDYNDRTSEVVETLRNGGVKYTGRVVVEGERDE